MSFDPTGFCDHAVDRRIAAATALQATDPSRANALWARVDREITDHAVWLPTETPTRFDVISRRVGNYQYHIAMGPLVDQLWVR